MKGEHNLTVKEYLQGLQYVDMRIEALDNYIDEQRAWELYKSIATKQVLSIRSTKHMLLLKYRYIDCMTWEQITDKLQYDNSDYVRKQLHIASLADFEKKYPRYFENYPGYKKDQHSPL